MRSGFFLYVAGWQYFGVANYFALFYLCQRLLDCLQLVNSHIRFKINPFGLQNPSEKRCKMKKLGESETKGEKNRTYRRNAIPSCFCPVMHFYFTLVSQFLVNTQSNSEKVWFFYCWASISVIPMKLKLWRSQAEDFRDYKRRSHCALLDNVNLHIQSWVCIKCEPASHGSHAVHWRIIEKTL